MDNENQQGWKECKLGVIAEFKNGKSRPHETTDGIIPIYGGNGILGYTNISNSNNEVVIIGRVGAYCGSVFYENRPIWISDNALFALPHDGYNAKYLFYFLKNLDLNLQAEGSSHPLLTQTLLNSLDVFFTDSLPEQQAIANVLSSLDDKIDLLHRQNKTLEAMAETLFRQWFVEEAGKSWKTVKVGDFVKTNILSINKDCNHKTIRYLDTGSLTEGKIDGYQIFDIADAPSRARRIVKHNDVLISTVRPNQKHYGILKHPTEDIIVSTGFCVITCDKINPHFIYLFLTTEEMTEYLHSIAEGSTSTYPSLKPSDVEKIEFQFPLDEIKLNAFSEYTDNIWNKIDYNHAQIQTLEKLRETLLPMLMSGDVRVAL
jgi:type I restriction enzyme, S subunit